MNRIDVNRIPHEGRPNHVKSNAQPAPTEAQKKGAEIYSKFELDNIYKNEKNPEKAEEKANKLKSFAVSQGVDAEDFDKWRAEAQDRHDGVK